MFSLLLYQSWHLPILQKIPNIPNIKSTCQDAESNHEKSRENPKLNHNTEQTYNYQNCHNLALAIDQMMYYSIGLSNKYLLFNNQDIKNYCAKLLGPRVAASIINQEYLSIMEFINKKNKLF